MPIFTAQADLAGLDDMVAGFLECAEFTMDEELCELKIRGWSRLAKKIAELAVRDFLSVADPADLDTYRREYAEGAGMAHRYSSDACIGHDLWFTGHGHGVGFSDRGNDPAFQRLHKVALYRYESANVWRTSGGWLQLDGLQGLKAAKAKPAG